MTGSESCKQLALLFVVAHKLSHGVHQIFLPGITGGYMGDQAAHIPLKHLFFVRIPSQPVFAKLRLMPQQNMELPVQYALKISYNMQQEG